MLINSIESIPNNNSFNLKSPSPMPPILKPKKQSLSTYTKKKHNTYPKTKTLFSNR